MPTLRHRPDRKTWEIDYRIGGVRQRKQFTFKENAKKFLRLIEDKIDKHRAGIQSIEPVSFGEFTGLFLENHFKTKSKSYQRSAKISLGLFLRFFGNDTLLTEISPQHIVAYRNKRTNDGVSNKTILNELGLLHMVFKKAIDNDFLEENPCSNIEKPRNIVRNERTIWSDEEFSFAMRHLGTEMQKALLILINTGMRLGELFQLDKADIHFENRIVAVKSKEGRTTKNYQGRFVPLVDTLVPLLNQIPAGKIMLFSQEWFRHKFEEFKRETGFPRVAHELRHTFISHALKAGIDKRTVQEWVGQKTPGVIERYTHVVPETNSQWLRLANKALNLGGEFVNTPAPILNIGHQMVTKIDSIENNLNTTYNSNKLHRSKMDPVGVEPTSEKVLA